MMVQTWLFLDQLSVPYFTVSIFTMLMLTLSLSFFLRVLKIDSPHYKSLSIILPIASPLFVYLFFPPSLKMNQYYLLNHQSIGVSEIIYSMMNMRIPSIIGVSTILGLGFGLISFLVLILNGHSILIRLLNVLLVPWDDFPELLDSTQRMARKAGVSLPQLGIVENIVPNAFTLGSRGNNYIVLTSGLLNSLNTTQIHAVLAHEIGHISNNDYHLSILVSSLRMASFFNPLAHLITLSFFREREYLADSFGNDLLDNKYELSSALTKISEITRNHRQSIPAHLVLGLLGINSINTPRNIMSLHPPVDQRLENLKLNSSRVTHSRDFPKTILSLILSMSLFLSFGVPFLMNSSLIFEPSRTFVNSSNYQENSYNNPLYGLSLSSPMSNPWILMRYDQQLIVLNDPVLVNLLETYFVDKKNIHLS